MVILLPAGFPSLALPSSIVQPGVLELPRSARHNGCLRPILRQGTSAVAKQSKKKAAREETAANQLHEEGLPVAAASPATLNKSEEIRTLARELQGRGESPRPVTIVKTLKARGITVSSPQVSMVLKKEGLERRPRKAKTSAPPVRTAGVAGADSFTVHHLLAAKKFVEMIGSARQAMALLDALDKIS